MAKPTPRNPQWKQKKPKLDDIETIRKLEEVFKIDWTIGEACYYAGISVDTYYRLLSLKPELSERFTRLRNMPTLLARQTLVKSLHTDSNIAMKYLERKKKDEFSTRTETTGKDWAPIEVLNKIQSLPTEELLKMLKQQ